MRSVMRGVVFGLVVVLRATSVEAQGFTASMLGTVTDSTGAALPGVTVTITAAQTSQKRVVTTDTAGHYVAPLLPPHRARAAFRQDFLGRGVATDSARVAFHLLTPMRACVADHPRAARPRVGGAVIDLLRRASAHSPPSGICTCT